MQKVVDLITRILNNFTRIFGRAALGLMNSWRTGHISKSFMASRASLESHRREAFELRRNLGVVECELTISIVSG